MSRQQTKKRIKVIAYFFVFDMLIGIFTPSVNTIYALTSGPGSPEFSSFEPVATTNMVDPFSGSFTYNLPVLQIPGPDGAGYAMSLSYHSGTSSEEDASWVGHGWTLNPGAINRAVRGYPDEYNNSPVDVYNKTRPNWTMSGTGKANLEIFSRNMEANPNAGKETDDGGIEPDSLATFDSKLQLSFSTNIRYNNYQGLAKTVSFGLAKGFGGLSMNRSATGITYSANINPYGLITSLQKEKKKDEEDASNKTENAQEKKSWVTNPYEDGKEMTGSNFANLGSAAAMGTFFDFQSFTDLGQPTTLSKLRGYNFNLSFGTQINPTQIPIGFEGGLIGGFSLNYGLPYETVGAYGYLNNQSEPGSYRSDYLVEKGQAFDRRDYFIGIPFSTPDSYLLTGEGLSGSFRPYNQTIGNYFPENIGKGDNKINTYGMGFELMFGANIGLGVSLAFGNTSSSMRDWKRAGNTNAGQFTFDNDDISRFRFNGDMGGKMEYGNNDLAVAELNPSPNFPGLVGVTPSLDTEDIADLDDTVAGSSTFIDGSNEKFSIHTANGLKYRYTLPVMNRNTASISIDATDGAIDNNYLVHKTLHMDADYKVDFAPHQTVVGEVRKEPYEATQLLESITTVDYIDVGNNGFDNTDFGGWTSFEYHKALGQGNDNGNDEWFRWRIPYTGLMYNKNSVSDVKDDTGFLNTGEKEVYYLKKVETKTHVAYFVTNKSTPERFGLTPGTPGSEYTKGTGAIRNDGLMAAGFSAEGIDLASNDPKAKGAEKLEYLEKVVLFSKARPDKPLQITNFQYDYSLVPNVSNNIESEINGNPENFAQSGKLTLKKVWSEFEGIYNARISSYKFDYRYKDVADYPDYLKNEKPGLDDFFTLSSRYSVNAQNPAYGPHLLDAWGYNQFDGENRHLKMRDWPYQGEIPDDGSFDPAAWQLKQVTLPSGGQILVQYEGTDYQYVQDRPAMTQVKIKEYNDLGPFPKLILDVEDLGITDDLDAKQVLVNRMKDHFLGTTQETDSSGIGKRIYFKFLYDLEGTSPSLDNCKSEYITGYAKVKSVKLVEDEVVIVLNGQSDGKNLVGFGLTSAPVADSNYQLTPRQACFDFYVTQRWGKYTAGCEGEFEKKYEKSLIELADNDRNGGGLIENFGDIIDIFKFTATGIQTLADGATNKKFPNKYSVCKTFNPELSYLKVPMHKAKRGGGMRVKRLLMYDKGIETGDAAIYGQVFKYELEDGTSSGVATNEPVGMREENALVEFLPKEDQSWLNRLIVGKDKEQSEGPIGETLLPGASVGHTRVVVENIHKGPTGSGYVINEYHTVKDYPFDKVYDYRFSSGGDKTIYDIGTNEVTKGVEYSVLQDNSYDDNLNIPSPNFSYNLDKAWASQGFRFILNSMHGKPKSVRTYGGSYQSGDRSFISSGQDFYYYEPGEHMKMLYPDGSVKLDVPGKEMDLTMEKYRIYNQNLDFDFEIDVSVGLLFPPPIFASGNLKFSFSEQNLSKYAVSKVIRYPSVQKKVVTYSDNIASVTENLGFDALTGNSILAKSYDAYHNMPLYNSKDVHDGSIYKLNLPAHWYYTGMGQKAINPNYSNQLQSSAGNIISYGENANPINSDDTWSIKTGRVVSASSNTYGRWSEINTGSGTYPEQLANLDVTYGSSAYLADLDHIYRPYKSYVFKENTKESDTRNTENSKIYDGGVMKSFTQFDYQLVDQDDRWVNTNQSTLYSPNGNILEEKNVLGVYSSARFGYDFTQPIMISQNARYNDIYFEHFEDKLNSETGLNFGNAHSGNYSKRLSSGTALLRNVIPSLQLADLGGWLNFWATTPEGSISDLKFQVGQNEIMPEKIASNGNWTLFRVFVPSNLIEVGQSLENQLLFSNEFIDIDDIRFQPKEAQSTCYVYDVSTLRLITVFDDQHFGLYYIYNDEGQLVRKMIETERGIQTISESQNNTPGEKREIY